MTRPHHFRRRQLPTIELQQRKFAFQRRKVPLCLVDDYRIEFRGHRHFTDHDDVGRGRRVVTRIRTGRHLADRRKLDDLSAQFIGLLHRFDPRGLLRGIFDVDRFDHQWAIDVGDGGLAEWRGFRKFRLGFTRRNRDGGRHFGFRGFRLGLTRRNRDGGRQLDCRFRSCNRIRLGRRSDGAPESNSDGNSASTRPMAA